MGELGDVFELVVTGPGRVQSVRAVAHLTLSSRGSGIEHRIWWAGQDRLRAEEHGVRPADGAIYVQDGSRWWLWREGSGAVTNTLGDPTRRAPMSGPTLLLGQAAQVALDPQLQVVGRDQVAGREAIILRTAEREIAVDAAYGVTLRAVHQGRLIWEVAEIIFDEPVPESCFEFSLPPGVELRAASVGQSTPMELEGAGASVDFPLFAPGPISVSWPVEARHWPARGTSPERVILELRNAPIWIVQSDRPDPESFSSRFSAPDEWRRTVRNGLELEVREHPVVVRFIRDGVHLEVYGEGDNIEELIAIALALRPVARGGG